MRFEGKVKENKQGTKCNVLIREQIEERLHLASIMPCINTANCRQRDRIRPQGNKGRRIETRETRDRNETEQGIGTKQNKGQEQNKAGYRKRKKKVKAQRTNHNTRRKERRPAPAASLSNKTKGDKNIQEGRQRGAYGKLIRSK